MRIKKILPSIGIILCAFMAFVIYSRHVNESVARENFTFISEVLSQSRLGAQRSVSDVFKSLERISSILTQSYGDNLESAPTMRFLQTMAVKSEFTRMGLVFPDGRVISTDHTVPFLLDKEYMQKAFQGLSTLSPLLHERDEKDHGVHLNVYATPFWWNGKVAAVLFAVSETTFLGKMLSTSVFDGQGLSYLIRSDGALVSAQRTNAFARYNDLYENFKQQHQLVAAYDDTAAIDTRGMIPFMADGKSYWGTVVPVGVDDLYMFTVVPASVIDVQASNRVYMTAGLLAALMALGLMMLVQIWNWIREAEQQRAIASEEAARNSAKSAFVSIMSHEMRTPLNAVVGFLHLLGRTSLDDYQSNAVRKAQMGASSLTRIISDVLDFSKIESGRLTLERAPFSVGMLADVLSSILSESASNKNIELHVVVAPDVPANLLGDGARLTQILLNLLNNAIKFTDHGEVSLHVDMQQLEDHQATLLFSVRDTGIGIEPDRVNELFGLFETGDGSTTRIHDGTGLGLPISKRLVELMGGKIGVDSALGQGSNFHFSVTLPVSETGAVTEHHTSTSATVMGDWAGKRVLVAEDNSINQEILREFLEGFGLSADMVENGEQAIELARISDYPLILMDIQMPKMDGIEATKRIRALGGDPKSATPWLAHTPIVALTANAMVEDRSRCLDAGMNDFMTKPINVDVMERCLHRWLSRSAMN